MLQSLQLDITVVVNKRTTSQGTGNKCSVHTVLSQE